MLTFNEMVPPAIVEVGIKPLSFKKINEYARELRTYGYLKLRPEAGMTIGSLFFDIDRIKTRYNNQFQNSNLSNLQEIHASTTLPRHKMFVDVEKEKPQ